MLRQAFQGARWHQHVARRSPSIPSLRLQRAFSTVVPRSTNYGGPNDKIRFYEQDTPSSKTRRRVDPEAEDRADRDAVKLELSKLDKELEVLKEGPYSPNSPFMRELPEKERAIALEALRKYEVEKGAEEPEIGLEAVFDEELDEMLREEFEGFAKEEEEWQREGKTKRPQRSLTRRPFEVAMKGSKSHPYIGKFNDCMRKFADDGSNDSLRQELWKWYRRCKQISPQFLESISQDTLNLLWDSQAQGEATKSTRSAHLQTLVEDASTIGRPLSTPQILSYIQTLHDAGETNNALDQWEAHQVKLSQQKEDLEAYWTLGVRIFAAEDDPQRAQDIALAFLASDNTRQPRVLIPVIAAWGRQSGKEAEVKAWALYLQLKTFLGPDMTMDDYDQISISLLKAGRANLALAVFKDMMVTGQDPANDSTALYKAALGLAGNLHASSINERDLNKISLSALTILPRRFQNRFFYASWMKKLIGMGEVDSAALVIELMYERGVRPDAKHLNGIISAWLREGNASARDKAERLGWAMIQQRIDTVWERGFPAAAKPVVVTKPTDDVRIPKFMQREVPPASIETFSILLLHYTRRGDDDMVKYLNKCLADAQIQPNSYFMNHLLYAELRKQDVHSLWQRFKAMSSAVKPDLETFACLWDCGKLQYDRGRATFDAEFPSARGIFSEMMGWYSQLTPRSKATTQEEFSKELYDQIVRCFCLSKDLHGTLVALYVLKDMFGFFPDDVTARMLVLQVARMAGVPADTPKRRLRRLSTTPKSKENIAQVNRLVELLSDRRAAALQAQGLGLEDLDPAERQHHQLGILSDLLRIVMGRTAAKPELVEGQIKTAAVQMGVAEADLGLPLDEGDSLLL